MTELDPMPWVHDCWDDGTCYEYGKRKHKREFILDQFEPRPEYEQDVNKYLGLEERND